MVGDRRCGLGQFPRGDGAGSPRAFRAKAACTSPGGRCRGRAETQRLCCRSLRVRPSLKCSSRALAAANAPEQPALSSSRGPAGHCPLPVPFPE